LRVLRSADRIACEDTRQTQKLLNHFGIATPTVSYHTHNEASRAVELVAELELGARIAVVSDAGTPGIADPGGILARAAITAGIAVIPVPGANALAAALSASGLAESGESAGQFRFLGFLPAKQGQRRTALETLRSQAGESLLHIAYEAPHRILDTLSDIQAVFGPGQPIVLARELTKMHEEFLRGTVADIHAQLARREVVRGEMVLLFTPSGSPEEKSGTTIAEQVRHLMHADGLEEKEALKRVARSLGIGKSEAYRELQRGRR
jgi:16S rRNA (cytidine1402-2'-O)-methyltransferase